MNIRIYNAALQKRLTPTEAKVYVYLLACSNCLGNAVVRMDVIAQACDIRSRSTVFTAIQGLCDKDLITKYRRRAHDGDTIANGYTITPQTGGWFLLDTQNRRIFRLDKSSFCVYLFLLKCRRHGSTKAFPSLSRMATALNICKNTIIAAIRRLIALRLIKKNRPSAAGRLNIYLLLSGVMTAFCAKKRNAPKRERTNTCSPIDVCQPVLVRTMHLLRKLAKKWPFLRLFIEVVHFLYSSVLTHERTQKEYGFSPYLGFI